MNNSTRCEQILPLPPVELRQLVVPTEEKYFDNPSGKLLFSDIPPESYESVFDFGCGCGRVARQLIQQNPKPKRYIGIDLHRGMIEWCKRNLHPYAPEFDFFHLNIFNAGLNPKATDKVLPFPVQNPSITLFIAWSVFTHVLESEAEFYLKELARILTPSGIAYTTWFLFDKVNFPMMQEFQNALYINDIDPTNAVIFDKRWLFETANKVGLTISRVRPPAIRGFQWEVYFELAKPGSISTDFPDDLAPVGINRPPLMPENADSLG